MKKKEGTEGERKIAAQRTLEQQDENAKALMEKMHGQTDSEKGNDADSQDDAMEQIKAYLSNHSETGDFEYLVRGATLVCRNGSHKRRVNLPKCHGVYIGNHPLLHELECIPGDGCNITMFGVCEPTGGETLESETVAFNKTAENSKDGSTGVVTGKMCVPVIIGTWQDTYSKTRVVDNGLKNPGDRAKVWMKDESPVEEATVTSESFLVCKYGGLIEPINSGQNEVNPDEHACDGETSGPGKETPHALKGDFGLPDYPMFKKDGKWFVGGSQMWFENSSWYSWFTEDHVIENSGCGLIAFGDLLLYLSMQDKKYQTPITDRVKPDDGEKAGYDYKSYMSYIQHLDNWYAAAIRGVGVPSFSLEDGFNRYSKKFGLGLTAKWGVKKEDILPKMSEMLENGLPVIISIGPDFNLGKKVGVPFYTKDSPTDEYKVKENWEESINGHYITIRGITVTNDSPPRTMLKASSWGDEYYIDYDKYLSYIPTSTPHGVMADSFSNMLYITEE